MLIWKGEASKENDWNSLRGSRRLGAAFIFLRQKEAAAWALLFTNKSLCLFKVSWAGAQN